MDATDAVSSIQGVQSIFQALTALSMTAYLYPPDATLKDEATFDYIVVGAGSAGSVIASRLTEIDDVIVLLVEAGDDAPFQSLFPSYMTYFKSSKWDWNYTSVPEGTQKCHKGGVTDMTRGKMLGGCSSNNYMNYVRGDPHDYNTWADIVNDQSWNYDNILPLFKKSENLKDNTISNSLTGKYHGTKGNLGVTKPIDHVTDKYIEALREIGLKIVLDTNGRDTLGFSQPMYTIADGIRQSTANSFLSPAKDRPNLFVAKNTLVIKIIFDENNNAIGVKTVNDDDEKKTFKATKEVIVSAGAINTVQLLILSGIGPKDHLKDIGITVRADLPVGENLQDHAPILLWYPTNKLTKQTEPEKPKNPHDLSAPQIIGYVTMNSSQTYPDYQAIHTVVTSDVALQLCVFQFAFNNDLCQKFYDESIGREVLFSLLIPLLPKSRGRILLRSSDPKDHPLIYLNTYGNIIDLDDAIEYTKDLNRIASSRFFQSVNASFLIPPGCEGLIPESDEYWLCHAQCMTTTIFHYVGTCPMGAVVDSRLRVRGVGRLRVADGSVMPTITSGNTNAPIIMIAEKAAEMIKEDNNEV